MLLLGMKHHSTLLYRDLSNSCKLHSSEPLEALFPVISPGVDSPLMAFIMMRTGDNYTGQ